MKVDIRAEWLINVSSLILHLLQYTVRFVQSQKFTIYAGKFSMKLINMNLKFLDLMEPYIYF
jgi:hypothetical protein